MRQPLSNAELAERLERTVGQAPGGWLYFKTRPSAEVVAAAAAALRKIEDERA